MIQQTEKPHLSPSQIGTYCRCPEQWRRRYVEREIIPPGIAAHVGSGYHAGAEVNFRQKIETHKDLPVADIVDAAVAGFEARMNGDGVMFTDEEGSRAQKVVGEAKDKLVTIAETFAEEVAPDYQPIEVEHQTRIVLPNASRDLLGITDLRDDQDRVVDFKTAGRKKSANDADSSLQLTVYAAAFLADHQRPPSEVRLDVVTTTKTPGRQILSTTRDQNDIIALRNRLGVILAAIDAELFPPCDPGSWCCSPKWCGYWGTCPYVNSHRRALAEKG